MGLTTDPNDPRIQRGGPDTTPTAQHSTYLVLSEEEREKGFVRPVRSMYKHVGLAGPTYPLADLTEEQRGLGSEWCYVKYEAYPPDKSSCTGRYWTQAQLDSVGKGCGRITTMGLALSETYAREPSFYGSTYCSGCSMHRPVGEAGEFVWTDDGSRVGT